MSVYITFCAKCRQPLSHQYYYGPHDHDNMCLKCWMQHKKTLDMRIIMMLVRERARRRYLAKRAWRYRQLARSSERYIEIQEL